MKWLLPSLALSLAPLAGCASTPIYGAWVINDYCGNTWNDGQPRWTRIDAPANADRYRQRAAEGERVRAPKAREYWFAAADGRVKFCLTSLTRAGGRWDWCNPRLADWWIFRDSETGPVLEQSHSPICVT